MVETIMQIEDEFKDPFGMALDFESYHSKFELASDFFFDSESKKFSAMQISMVANCGNLSSDREINDF